MVHLSNGCIHDICVKVPNYASMLVRTQEEGCHQLAGVLLTTKTETVGLSIWRGVQSNRCRLIVWGVPGGEPRPNVSCMLVRESGAESTEHSMCR